MLLPIETRRLLIRLYEEKDLEDIFEYSGTSDFWLMRTLSWQPTRESVKKFWEARRYLDPSMEFDQLDLVIEWKEKSKVIGNIGIGISRVNENKQGMIGWLLGSKFQGQGFASEAARSLLFFSFDKLGLHRISASTSRDNIRSWLLMERIGMRREAHFKQSEFVNGEWQDEFIYAVLAEEWHSKQ
jgi:RimJ/RimL family protein N-acetyltransferase